MTASSNAPPTAVVPTSTAGRTRSIVSTRPGNSAEKPYPVNASAGQRDPALGVIEVLAPVVDHAARIDEHDGLPDGSLGHAVLEHRETQQAGDADARRPGPDEHDPCVGEPRPEAAQAGQHAGDHDRGGPLDVVVEGRHAVPVAIEDAQRVVLLEVLPLDEAVGPDLGDALDERLDERVVGRPPQARRPMADVQRVLEEGRIVGPDVERDRQGDGRMDPARRVQGELADRDGHPAGALVAQAEDPLVVGDDDEPDVDVRALAEELRDPVAVGRGDPRPARPADDVAELLARPADRRRVDDRQELLEVLGDDAVEQRRVAILERGQPDVALERVVLAPQVLELELDLLVDGQDAIRQEAREAGTRRVPRR